MTEFKTKQELLSALKEADERVTKWFEGIPTRDFFTRHAEVWSASDNMDHLIRSHKPIVKAFKLPRITVRAMFGKPNKASMSYETFCRVYREEIARGGVASGSYLPNQQTPQDAEAEKREILERWSSVSTELIAQAEKWSEDELDQYQLPHPLLGNLTVREILFFSLYHNLRHATQQSVQPTAFGASGRGLIPCKRRGLQWSHPLQSAAANANRWAASVRSNSVYFVLDKTEYMFYKSVKEKYHEKSNRIGVYNTGWRYRIE